jgi:hypothetical protein
MKIYRGSRSHRGFSRERPPHTAQCATDAEGRNEAKETKRNYVTFMRFIDLTNDSSYSQVEKPNLKRRNNLRCIYLQKNLTTGTLP